MDNQKYKTQNSLLLNNLMNFYNKDNNLEKILPIINVTLISLRLMIVCNKLFQKIFHCLYA